MKTAISIPDPIFQAGETLAKHLNLSRSQLYTKALQIFIAAHDAQHITDALNEVYDEHSSSIDPSLAQMQIASLPREDW
jgi:metal-responsive CopG/Arc/MetJ family transcriptional regulator